MSVAISSPALLTGVRLAIAATLTAEFLAEEIDFAPVKLNSTAAMNQPTGAVFALGWKAVPQNVNQIIVTLGVQIFDQWAPDALPDPSTYDPTLVEQWAQRASVALKANEHAIGVWFLRVAQAALSPDSAGNPSQVELLIEGYTDNPFGF